MGIAWLSIWASLAFAGNASEKPGDAPPPESPRSILYAGSIADEGGAMREVLAEADPLMHIPSKSWARVRVLDGSGKAVWDQPF